MCPKLRHLLHSITILAFLVVPTLGIECDGENVKKKSSPPQGKSFDTNYCKVFGNLLSDPNIIEEAKNVYPFKPKPVKVVITGMNRECICLPDSELTDATCNSAFKLSSGSSISKNDRNCIRACCEELKRKKAFLPTTTSPPSITTEIIKNTPAVKDDDYKKCVTFHNDDQNAPWNATIKKARDDNKTIYEYYCAAIIIHPQVVITDRDCINGIITITSEDHKRNGSVTITSFRDHKSDRSMTRLVLLRLNRKLTFSKTVRAACLAAPEDIDRTKGCRLFTSSVSTVLKMKEEKLQDSQICKNGLKKLEMTHGHLQKTICSLSPKSETECLEQEGKHWGSALMCELRSGELALTGMLSHMELPSNAFCASQPRLNYYTDVSASIPWIKDQFRKWGLETSYFTQ